MRRLTWRNERGQACFLIGDIEYVGGEIAERLAAYEDAKELMLPCKPGDVLYLVDRVTKRTVKKYVGHIEMSKIGVEIHFVGGFYTTPDRIGIAVFRTEKEAEQALLKIA